MTTTVIVMTVTMKVARIITITLCVALSSLPKMFRTFYRKRLKSKKLCSIDDSKDFTQHKNHISNI